MPTRFALFPGIGALLAAVALASLSLFASGADGRVRLDASVLEQSRGRGLGNTARDQSCDTHNDATPCEAGDLDKVCTSCTKATFFGLIDGTIGGNVQSMTISDCGTLEEGTCDSLLQCVNMKSTHRGCDAPNVVLEQTDPGGGMGAGH